MGIHCSRSAHCTCSQWKIVETENVHPLLGLHLQICSQASRLHHLSPPQNRRNLAVFNGSTTCLAQGGRLAANASRLLEFRGVCTHTIYSARLWRFGRGLTHHAAYNFYNKFFYGDQNVLMHQTPLRLVFSSSRCLPSPGRVHDADNQQNLGNRTIDIRQIH